MVRYPHKCTLSWKSKPMKGEDGNYTPGVDIVQEVECRAEPEGGSSEIKGIDGSLTKVSFGVYMAKQSFIAPVGSSVVVMEGDEILFNGPLLRMHNRQTHSRLWL
jgi:hypothetical protein